MSEKTTEDLLKEIVERVTKLERDMLREQMRRLNSYGDNK